MTPMNHAAEVVHQLTSPGAPFELQPSRVGDPALNEYCHAPQSLADVIRSSRRDDDSCFLVYQDIRWSYQTFFQQVDRLASWMNQQGVRPGQAVAIAMRNRPEWAAAFAATALIGAVPAPLNSFGLREELELALDSIQPVLLICDQERAQRLESHLQTHHLPALLVGQQTDTQHQAQITTYEQVQDTQPTALPECHPKPEDPALILFTSGATSRAKAVLSSQHAVCQALYNIDYISAFSALTSPEKIAGIMRNPSAPVILSAVPMFHVSGLHAQLLTALRTGRRLIFMHRWDPQEAISIMKQEQVTQFNGAPSMVMQLLREADFFDCDLQQHFAGLGFGGAGLTQSIIEKVLNKLPDKMVGVGFGMTESNGVGAAVSGDLFNAKAKSSGLVSPLINVKICTLDGDDLPPGEVGEILLQGAPLMQEYIGDERASAEAMRNGWLHTGDLGYLDDAGFLYIVDRIKDVINRSGENIAAAEVESCLVKYPGALEAAVFGVPDDTTGEAVIAVVSVKEQQMPSEPSLLRDFVAEQLAAYKVPREIYVTSNPLPHNPAGKLLKATLKNTYLSDQNQFCQNLA